MALVVYDRVQESTTTAGTGSVTLGGAVAGFQSFAVVGNGNTTYYTIVSGTAWEVGIGTVGAATLARTSVLASSNAGSLVTFSAGTKDVFVTYPAEVAVFQNGTGTRLATVNFQGGGPQLQALLGGHIDVGFNSIGELLVQHKAGAIRVSARSVTVVDSRALRGKLTTVSNPRRAAR